jgi:hypothetical protein
MWQNSRVARPPYRRQAASERWNPVAASSVAGIAEHAERVEDHGDVEDFLQQRASLTPSPTIITAPAFRSESTTMTF